MPPDYFVFACFAIALYFYVNQYNQVRSTASAIRSVYTGECRSACRQSATSGLSGLSSYQDAGPSDRVGPNCVCESCPCHTIENLLRTCSPVTRMYTGITSTLSRLYCSIIASIIGTNNYDSNENFTFKDPVKSENSFKEPKPVQENDDYKLATTKDDLPSLEEKGTTTSKISLARKKSTSFFKGLLIKKKNKGEGKSGKDLKTESSATPSGSDGCPKCVEEGKTCLRECPKAKK